MIAAPVTFGVEMRFRRSVGKEIVFLSRSVCLLTVVPNWSSLRMKFLNCRPYTVLIQMAGFLSALPAFASGHGETTDRFRVMEAYPEPIRQRLEMRGSALHAALTTASALGEQVTVQYVLDMACRWKPGNTLTVAFSGGTPDRRSKIETPACTKCLAPSDS